MKPILTVIVAYAVVFAPGCRQTTSNLQNKKSSSITDRMVKQAYKNSEETGKGFEAILNNRHQASKKVNVYASYGTDTIKKVDASILQNFNNEKPLTDADGNSVSRLFIQHKDGNQAAILGVRYQHNKQALAIFLEDLTLEASSAHKSYDLTDYTTDDLKRHKAVPMKMNLQKSDAAQTRRDATTAAQSSKVLLESVAAKMSPVGFGLKNYTTADTILLWMGVVAGLALMVIALVVLAITVANIQQVGPPGLFLSVILGLFGVTLFKGTLDAVLGETN